MQTADVTVITPAIASRIATFLPETLESVATQTVQPAAHLVGIDHARRGHGPILNELLRTVTTRYVVLLADDDTLHPTHLERCLETIGGADVCYPYADLSTWPTGSIQRAVINQPWTAASPDRIQQTNWIPGGGALIRLSALRRIGGLSERPEDFHHSDWLMWRDIAATGGRFVCIPEPLWSYRCHPQQLQAVCDGRSTRPLEDLLWPT
jgi:hypothetical protein